MASNGSKNQKEFKGPPRPKHLQQRVRESPADMIAKLKGEYFVCLYRARQQPLRCLET